MLERLRDLEREFLEVEARLADPALIADQPRYQQVARRYRELEPIVADADAIVLTGSFGRGEGGAMVEGGSISALNDFDVLVVGGPDVSRELAGASATLAARVGLDFLDLAWADGTWSDFPATMLNVDIRYGSQVLRGFRHPFKSRKCVNVNHVRSTIAYDKVKPKQIDSESSSASMRYLGHLWRYGERLAKLVLISAGRPNSHYPEDLSTDAIDLMIAPFGFVITLGKNQTLIGWYLCQLTGVLDDPDAATLRATPVRFYNQWTIAE